MSNLKRNLIVSIYLITIIGLGVSSLFTGKRIAERQSKVTPQETEAGEPEACLRCCGNENGVYGEDKKPRWLCGGCGFRKPKDCLNTGRLDPEAEDCWKDDGSCVFCNSLTANKSDFQFGQTYTFTCSGTSISWDHGGQVNKYQYRVKIGNDPWGGVIEKPSSGDSSFSLTINQHGHYTVQCRACAILGCGPWESL
jgi:hypothetical protein